ncbi:MAG: DUF2125 domain-containing protein [Bradyrhizobium sp.]|uniref:DUF2125 domain-containing protein n=1 Tax=Bradyrhizobium sp. TaxID=376 RepID=UPI001DE322A7|nr:DUF2125 domain-containing protein [Bradyrhizobium sp.]MBV9566004.1 DUF2125 domain-containing protein [Bradyrhizobium sp.]
MSDIAFVRRRRPLWPVFVAPVLVVILAIAWSAFWFYAASQVDGQADAWRAREAKSGRVFDCAHRAVAGFPFRLEVRCDAPSVTLVSQTAAQGSAQGAAPIKAQLGQILVVAQVYDPKHVIAEFTAPATISDSGAKPAYAVDWSLGRSSVIGLPGTPQRASIVFDNPAIDRIDGAAQAPLARAKHVELHGRIAEGSPADHPKIESVLEINQGSIQGLHPLLAEPFNCDVRAMLSGLSDFAPKPWPARFREMQAAGGSVEIEQSRIEQGELVAIAAGKLELNASGQLQGELQMTVAGIEKVIAALGIDKMLDEGVPQATLDRVAPGVKSQDISKLMGALDRAIPGLGKVVKQNANAGVAAGINALGKEATLEGRKARSFPLRFVDGAVLLGPLKVAQIPPLF